MTITIDTPTAAPAIEAEAAAATITQAAIVIYTSPEDNLSRVYRALGTAQEFIDGGDDVVVVFDGSGVEALAQLSDPDHQLHPMLTKIADHVAGACGFCAKSYGVADQITTAGWNLLGDYRGHASIRNLVTSGYQVITF